VELGSGPPIGPVTVEAHEQLHVTNGSEAEVVEHLDRGGVASHRLDVHVCSSSATRLLDRRLDERSAHTHPPVAPTDHDRLDRGLLTLPQQPSETDRSTVVDSDPREDTLRERQVLVEAGTRIPTTDRAIVVDLAMVLDQLRVQVAAGVEVLGSVLPNTHRKILSSREGSEPTTYREERSMLLDARTP
jgi:hypothetical protein